MISNTTQTWNVYCRTLWPSLVRCSCVARDSYVSNCSIALRCFYYLRIHVIRRYCMYTIFVRHARFTRYMRHIQIEGMLLRGEVSMNNFQSEESVTPASTRGWIACKGTRSTKAGVWATIKGRGHRRLLLPQVSFL